MPATLGPGLIALAGALFLLSVGEPTTAAVGFGFALGAAAALLLGAFAVLAHAALVHWPPVHATLLASSSAGLLFWAGVLLSSGTHGRFAGVAHQVWSPTFALELAVAALGIFLLREIPATSYTTRYLWAPLIAAAESYVAVRPPLSWRIVAGGIMLATGGVLLLRQDRHVPDEVLGLNQILLGSTSEPRIDSEHGRFDVHRRGG